MKLMLFIFTVLAFTHSHAELVNGFESTASQSETEAMEASLAEEVFGVDAEEVTITPLYEFAGSGRTPPNCSCSGEASYYGKGFHGRKTANGEIFNKNAMTAAHRCLPLGTKIRVCLKRNTSKCLEVRVNDRGPYVGGRILDLSEAAARQLGFINAGHAQVTLSRCK